MGHVRQSLVVGIGVHRGHDAVLDSERIVEHLGQRREAIRGARGVRHKSVLGLELVIVDAHDDHLIDIVLGRHGEEHALGTRSQMLLEIGARGEDPRRLDHHVDAQLFPFGLGRISDAGHQVFLPPTYSAWSSWVTSCLRVPMMVSYLSR